MPDLSALGVTYAMEPFVVSASGSDPGISADQRLVGAQIVATGIGSTSATRSVTYTP